MEPRFAFTPPPPVVIPVTDGRIFPARHVWCVARNYADHAREMGADPNREPPFFFAKAAHAIATGPAGRVRIAYPPATADLHHEVELVVALGPGERWGGIAIFGYAVGIDLTRRDRQAEAKKAGRPWEVGKSFTGAAPLGPIIPVERAGHPRRGAIGLAVDGVAKQAGDLAQMIWSVEDVLEHLARYDRLAPGDLVFTGTPAGVGAVERGQTLSARIDGLESLTVEIF